MKQLFYVFDEHTDFFTECKKAGLKPCGEQFATEFFLGDTKYILLSPHECYSGFAITIMALPYMDYETLIKVIESSKVEDEIIGSIGILLKKYTDSFTEYLSRTQTRKTKKIKKIILKHIVENSQYVSKMKQLIEVCKS